MRKSHFLLVCILWAAPALFAARPADFGALGNGVEDDTAALRSALETGEPVLLDGKRYRITGTLAVPEGGGIHGPGTIVHDFDISLPPSPPSGADTAIRLASNTTLDGFALEKTFVDGSYAIGIISENREHVSIRNLEIKGYSARYGIHIVESENFSILGCTIRDFMVNTTTDMIEDSPAGIRITRSKYGIVSNNRLMDIEVGPQGLRSISPIRPSYGEQGYQSDHITVVQSRYITLAGNVMRTSGEGIDMLLSDSCTLTGNIVADIWGEGIKMLGVSYTSVSGNTLVDCGVGMNIQQHPSFGQEGSGNTVSGNTFINMGSPGSFPDQHNRPYGNHSYSVNLASEAGCRANIVSDNVSVDTQASPTAEGGVNNEAGGGNLVTDNLFTTEVPPTGNMAPENAESGKATE